MPSLKNTISQFKTFNNSRKISIVIFIILLLIFQIISILIAISILNFSQLLSNIKIPAGYIYFEIDIDSPEIMTAQIPYEIYNPGIYELSDIHINVDIKVNYINESNQANITSQIFSKKDTVSNCKALQTKTGLFEGDFSSFIITPLINFFAYSDELVIALFLLDVQFKAKYFYGLIEFQITQYNLNLFIY